MRHNNSDCNHRSYTGKENGRRKEAYRTGPYLPFRSNDCPVRSVFPYTDSGYQCRFEHGPDRPSEWHFRCCRKEYRHCVKRARHVHRIRDLHRLRDFLLLWNLRPDYDFRLLHRNGGVHPRHPAFLPRILLKRPGRLKHPLN